MGYRTMGRAHASLARMRARLRDHAGQGTVEYVALMLLVAGLLTAVIAVADSTQGVDAIPKAIANKLKSTIEGLGKAAHG
jgi:hypothetical protein